MKKGSLSKALSLFMTLVMITVMIPMGAVSAFATDADVDLNADTVIIDSVADWKAVAAATDNTFEGKTVALGASIEFGEEAAPVLFNKFMGTFLGNGYTVSGTTLAGKNLIATTVVGGTIDGGDGTADGNKVMTVSGFTATSPEKSDSYAIVAGQIKDKTTVCNIKIVGCTINAGNTAEGSASSGVVVAQIAAATTPDSDPVANFDDICSVISNCTVTDCTLTARSMSGFILGSINSDGYVKITDCTVDGASSISAYQAAVGAIIGKLNAKTYAVVSGCKTGADVSITNAGYGNYWAFSIGMAVGQTGTNGTTKGAISITDCELDGQLKPASGTTLGGVLGSTNLSGATVITDCKVNVKFTLNAGNYTVGGVLGNYHGCEAGSLTIARCTVTSDLKDAKSSGGSPRVGGILGRGQGTATGATIIEQCYVDSDISGNASYDKLGGIVGDWNTGSSALTIRNCVYIGTVTSAKSNAAAVIGTKSSAVTASTITLSNIIIDSPVDTKVCASTTLSAKNSYYVNGKVEEEGFMSVSEMNETLVDALVKYDANGFIVSVNDYVRCGLVQVSNAVNGGYMVRFIGTSIFDSIESAHMKITATLNGEARVFEADCTAYDILTAHTSAAQIANITSESFGAEKFVAITVNNIPAASANDIVFDIELTVKAGGVEYKAAVNDMLIPPVA